MGNISNSWVLVKQSFAILRDDKELMLVPVLSAISCVLVTASYVGGGLLLLLPEIRASATAGQPWHASTSTIAFALFIFYFINYFVIVFFNTALVSAASVRLSGGKPQLGDALRAAWERAGVIFQWAALAATVGMILKLIEDRSEWVGRLAASLFGIAWSLATFFVVPILAFEELGPIDALKRSSQLFRKNWGEEVVGTFSFGLIFFLLALPGVLLPIAGASLAGGYGATAGAALMVVYFILLAVVSSATHGIFLAALYRYATAGEGSLGFARENLSAAWRPK
jgi:Family of unknown function (DUF6159)